MGEGEVESQGSRALLGARFPHPSLTDSHQDGCTEPWIAQLVSSLLAATGGRTVLETGGFQGTTSAWLGLTLEQMGGGKLVVAELEDDRADAIQSRLASLPIPNVDWAVERGDVLHFLPRIDNDVIDLAFVDDSHEKPHVEREIELLWSKMRSGGLIAFHDVFGSVDLQEVVRKYQGYCLDLPRLGPAGGLGIIQVR